MSIKPVSRNRTWIPMLCFMLGVFFVALPASILIPPGGQADEPSHIARVDQLAEGTILPQKVGYRPSGHSQQDALYGGRVDKALVNQSTNAMVDFHVSQHRYVFPTWKDKKANLGLVYGNSTTSFVFSNTAINSPVVYLPQICGFLIARLFTHQAYWLIVAMRIGGILFFLLTGLVALWRITSGRWMMAASLLLPGTLLIFSGVTADLVTFCCIALLFAESIRAYDLRRLSTADLTVLCCSVVMLGMVKTVYIPCLAFVIIPFLHRQFRTKRMIVPLSVSSAISCILFLLWYMVIHSISSCAMYSSKVNPHEQVHYLFGHFPKTALKIVTEAVFNHGFFGTSELGIIGSRGRQTTLRAGTVVTLLLLTACFYEAAQRCVYTKIDRVAAVIMAVIVLICSLLVCLAMFIAYTHVGARDISGVQDRYYLPLILPALLSLCWLVAGPVAHSDTKKDVLTEESTEVPAAVETRHIPVWAVVTSSILSIMLGSYAVLTIFR